MEEREVSGESQHTGSLAGRLMVNVLIALPFFAVGVVGLARDDLRDDASLAVVLVGALVVLVGLYVSVLSRPRLNLMPNEETLALRHPSMKPAFARIALSVPFFLAAGYLLQFTTMPYVYPFVPFVIAMYLYFRGVIKYWVNHHTTYYVTSRRAVHVYRFIWLDTTEGRETPRTGFGGAPPEEIATVANVLFNDLVARQGLTPETARERLLRTEPFHNHPDLVAGLRTP